MATQYCVLQLLQDLQATSFLKIYGFAITLILNFVQLKYEAQDQKTPFQTHPKTMHVSVVSLLIYCLLYDIRQRFSSHPLYRSSAPIVSRAMLFFALLSLLSATSLLFPESVRGILYALCILLSVGDCLHAFFQRIKNRFDRRDDNNIMELMHFPSLQHSRRLPV